MLMMIWVNRLHLVLQSSNIISDNINVNWACLNIPFHLGLLYIGFTDWPYVGWEEDMHTITAHMILWLLARALEIMSGRRSSKHLQVVNGAWSASWGREAGRYRPPAQVFWWPMGLLRLLSATELAKIRGKPGGRAAWKIGDQIWSVQQQLDHSRSAPMQQPQFPQSALLHPLPVYCPSPPWMYLLWLCGEAYLLHVLSFWFVKFSRDIFIHCKILISSSVWWYLPRRGRTLKWRNDIGGGGMYTRGNMFCLYLFHNKTTSKFRTGGLASPAE